MSFIDKIASFLKGDKLMTEEDLYDSGICPNCWGKQEYDGERTEYTQIKDVAGQKAFVSKFVETHLDGIKLEKNGDVLICKRCNTKVTK